MFRRRLRFRTPRQVRILDRNEVDALIDALAAIDHAPSDRDAFGLPRLAADERATFNALLEVLARHYAGTVTPADEAVLRELVPQ